MIKSGTLACSIPYFRQERHLRRGDAVLAEDDQVVKAPAQFLEGRAVTPEDVVGGAVFRRHQEDGADREHAADAQSISRVQPFLPAGQLVQVVAVGVAHLLNHWRLSLRYALTPTLSQREREFRVISSDG